MTALKNMNVRKVAAAIEKGAGRTLPGLRISLKQAKTGQIVAATQKRTHSESGTQAGTTEQ